MHTKWDIVNVTTSVEYYYEIFEISKIFSNPKESYLL